MSRSTRRRKRRVDKALFTESDHAILNYLAGGAFVSSMDLVEPLNTTSPQISKSFFRLSQLGLVEKGHNGFSASAHRITAKGIKLLEVLER